MDAEHMCSMCLGVREKAYGVYSKYSNYSKFSRKRLATKKNIYIKFDLKLFHRLLLLLDAKMDFYEHREH